MGKRPTGVSGAPYLRIEQLCKKFGSFEALKNVSLVINEGEFVCFLGPSGCGKTTLLRAIAGLDPQTSGTIEQAGRDISALPPSQRDFGIVFQSYALFPNLTVIKNVAYGLENRKMRRGDARKRAGELLEMVGLADQAEKFPAHLSGGQQQRVALARALATSPGLLLPDEPLSALDAKVRLHLRRLRLGRAQFFPQPRRIGTCRRPRRRRLHLFICRRQLRRKNFAVRHHKAATPQPVLLLATTHEVQVDRWL